MIEYQDVAAALQRERGDAVVVTAMTQTRFWKAASDRPELDIPTNNSMGKASSIGFGIAIGAPGRKVIVQDGDGSLIMNLGSLITVAGKSPKNFYHVVYDNGMYAVTGGQPIPGAGNIDWPGLALASGYRAAYSFDDTEEMATEMPRIMAEEGPIMIHVKVKPVITTNLGVIQTWESNAVMPAQMRSVKAELASA
ncbi:MAG: thiamine pyrophosphate-dependent enzyme [Chloroflexi bacterium]|nr:thiamine pyrophosphate-dependent enzyme [Chloroflexota bacterium]